MALNTSIPLAINQYQAPDLLGQAQQAAQIQGLQQQNQMRQMQLDEQKAEVEAFKGADFSTPEGRNAALVNVMQKAPQVGLKMMAQFSNMERMQAQSKHFIAQADADHLKVVQGKQKAIAEAATPAWNAYQKALSEGKSDQIARAEADKLMPEAISSLQSSGVFNEDEMAKIPRTFDPNVVGGALMTTGLYSKMLTDRLHEAQAKSAEASAKLKTEQAEDPEKFHPKPEKGYQLFTDADGNTKAVNPNTGDVKDLPGLKGLKKVGTGGTQGGGSAKVQQRVALVTGAAKNAINRLDEIEKEFGDQYSVSPVFGEHPETALGKTAAAVTRVAIGKKQQKFDAQAGSFIDEAIPVFTGGLRGSDAFRRFLAAQLPQVGEDPETRKEKWRLFRENIQGMSNSFATAYQGNPQYWGQGQGALKPVTQQDVQTAQTELQQGKQPPPQESGGTSLNDIQAEMKRRGLLK